MTKKIYIAADHAGFELKSDLIKSLTDYDFVDLGTNSAESVDYPDYAQVLANKVLSDKDARGILICGSGVGMSISANRFAGIRAALVMNKEIAELSRKHNNSNVLVLAARFSPKIDALAITKTWLETDFEAGRHQRRVDKLDQNITC